MLNIKSAVALLVGATAIFLSGCGTLRSDNVIPAIDANYPTVEFSCNDQKFVGLGVCTHDGAIRVSIQGYFTGNMRVDSERCGIRDAFTYTNNMVKTYEILATTSCVIDVTVSPEYQRYSDTKQASLVGQIYLKYLTGGKTTIAMESKISKDTDEMFVFTSDAPARVVFKDGDTSVFDKIVDPVGGAIQIRFSDLSVKSNRAVLEGVAFLSSGPQRLTWHVWVYDSKFVPLAFPSISYDGKRVRVVMDKNVAITELDGDVSFSESPKFKTESPNTMRLLTAGGRVVIGRYSDGGWSWIR